MANIFAQDDSQHPKPLIHVEISR